MVRVEKKCVWAGFMNKIQKILNNLGSRWVGTDFTLKQKVGKSSQNSHGTDILGLYTMCILALSQVLFLDFLTLQISL